MTGRAVLQVRFLGHRPEEHPALVGLLTDLTPVVRALPPEGALADVGGALRYFGADAERLAGLLRVRALARHGVDCAVGVAHNPLLARLALVGRDGPGVWAVPGDPGGVAAFLAGLPVDALPGVGASTARALAGYGLGTVGRLAAAPPAALQRVLGAREARRLRALAEGQDPTPVVPGAPEPTLAVEHRFDRDELDAGRRHRALLTLADELGYRLRGAGQTAGALTLTVRYADHATTTRRRGLAEPTAHTPALLALADALHEALGLQRARVRAVALRAEGLAAAERATRQLSLDPADERRRGAERAADRARRRFGERAVGPAARTVVP
ncbi:DNA polymerase Y family protein [Streptomyces sedi]|uniref:UmuC domain-containing protein n=1 Tax=Streptomyces sedi TaxID=555059 RepID=A0A5C4US59_9ACTN|nr:helix-hairpin-helix domain-containing protein [Streptomyces sedi]TNM26332.1 hypothetical protein FH715_24160 [Streptomyces sedi]